MSNDNRRSAYRVPLDIAAEIASQGRSQPVRILNISAGGALFDADAPLQAGSTVQLRMVFKPEWVPATGTDRVVLELELIDVAEIRDEPPIDEITTEATESALTGYRHRARSLAPEGSPEFELMHRIVFAAERHRLSQLTGAGQASPMASDPERRAARRPKAGDRFSRGSINPLHDD